MCPLLYPRVQLKNSLLLKNLGELILLSRYKKSFSIQNYVELAKEHGIQLKLIQVRLLKLKSYKYAIIHTISFNRYFPRNSLFRLELLRWKF